MTLIVSKVGHISRTGWRTRDIELKKVHFSAPPLSIKMLGLLHLGGKFISSYTVLGHVVVYSSKKEACTSTTIKLICIWFAYNLDAVGYFQSAFFSINEQSTLHDQKYDLSCQ